MGGSTLSITWERRRGRVNGRGERGREEEKGERERRGGGERERGRRGGGERVGKEEGGWAIPSSYAL